MREYEIKSRFGKSHLSTATNRLNQILRLLLTMNQAQRRQIGKKNTAKSSQELLKEIRKLLSPTQKENNRKHLSAEEIDQLLRQSLNHYRKQPQSNNPQLIQRAEEAVKVIQKKHSQQFIQHYTKQKVYSDLFFNLRKEVPESQILYYQKQRQGLIRQRQIQQEQQRKRQAEIIASRKKFIRYQSNTLPYVEINEFRSKEGEASLPYLINQPSEKQQISQNNKIRVSRQPQLQRNFDQKKSHKILNPSNSRTFIGDDSNTIQVVDNDETMNQEWYMNQRRKNINKMLTDNGNFLNIMKRILEKCISLQKSMNQEESPPRNRTSIMKSQAAVKYMQGPQVYKSQKNYEKIRDLTKIYKYKGIILQNMNGRSIKKAQKVLCEKVISKMIGDSANFHPKKVQLKQQEIYWCQENEQVKEDSKKIQLVVQEIATTITKKEEGGIFSRTVTEVQIVTIKGKSRKLIFQKNFLEGREFYKELCTLMAQKLLELNSLVSCRVNEQLTEFVRNQKATSFSLASNFLQEHEKSPQKDYKLMIINVFAALFPFRLQIIRLNLQNVRLNSVQLCSLVKSLSPLTNLQQILISKANFNADILSAFFKFVSELPCNQIKVELSQCGIQDSMLIKAHEIVNCTNIKKLNLSKNRFTLQGFGIVLKLSQQKNCEISELNVSGNKIKNLISLGQFVKMSQNLQYLYAQDCEFSLDSHDQIYYFFRCCKNSKLKVVSLLGNSPVNSFHPFQQSWVNDYPQQIWIQAGAFVEKTSKNLQGKLLQE